MRAVSIRPDCFHAGHIPATQSRSMRVTSLRPGTSLQVTSLRLICVHAGRVPATSFPFARLDFWLLPGAKLCPYAAIVYSMLLLKERGVRVPESVTFVDQLLFVCPQRFTSFPPGLRSDSFYQLFTCIGTNRVVLVPLCCFLLVFPLQNKQTLQRVR